MVDEDGECHVVRRVALWLRQSASAEYDEIGDMADFMLGASRTSALCWDDFSDYIEHAGLARELLRGAAGERTMGINILIHGDPGTGKTEFVKVLAAEIGLSLFAAAEPEPDGSFLIANLADGKFRPAIPKALLQVLGEFPPGILVRLENNEVGVVTRRPVRARGPFVKAIFGPRGNRYTGTFERDTSEPDFGIQSLEEPEVMPSMDFSLVWGFRS